MCPRVYRQTARATAAAATAERILDVAAELFWERPTDQLALETVAERAGVSVQTVIRRFGGKAGLFAAAGEREVERVREQRAEAPVDDLEAAVAVLVEHYEQRGRAVLRLLAEETRVAALATVVESGREVHREWCETVFATTLAPLRGAARRRRLAQLMAVCDVFTWRLLRLDAGLSRHETERALVELLTPLTEVPR